MSAIIENPNPHGTRQLRHTLANLTAGLDEALESLSDPNIPRSEVIELLGLVRHRMYELVGELDSQRTAGSTGLAR